MPRRSGAHGEPRPTAESIGQAADDLWRSWDGARTEWKAAASYYHRTYSLWAEGVPAVERPSYRPARPTAKVDQALATLKTFQPQVHRLPPSPEGVRSKSYADEFVEPWLAAFWRQNGVEAPLLPFIEAGFNLLLYNRGVLEGPIVREAAPPEEAAGEPGESGEDALLREATARHRRRHWLPFVVTAPAPWEVLLDPQEVVPTFAVKRARWRARDIEAMLAHRRGRNGRYAGQVGEWAMPEDPLALIQCDEYWTDAWHAMMERDGALLFVEENTWGFVPFTVAWGGFGHPIMEEMDGDKVGGQALAYMARGLLAPAMESIKMEAQAKSAHHNILIEQGFSRIGTTDTGSQAQEKLAGRIVPETRPGTYYPLEVAPKIGADMFHLVQEYQADVEEGTFSNVLAGFRPEGVTTFAQQATMRRDSGAKLAVPVLKLGHMATLISQRLLMLVDALGEEVTIGGKTLGPKQIEHHYDVEVVFESIDPVVKFQEQEQARLDVKEGLKSKEAYLAIAGVGDVEGELRRIGEDRVMESAPIQALLGQITELGLGITELRQQLAALAPPTQPGAPPQGLVDAQGRPIGGPPPAPPGIAVPGQGAFAPPPGSLAEAQAVALRSRGVFSPPGGL